MNKKRLACFLLILGLMIITLQPLQAQEQNPHKRYRLDVGFSHWFADSFRSAEQGKAFAFGVGLRPLLKWLEIQGRYEFAKIRSFAEHAYYPEFHNKTAHFITIGAGLIHDFLAGKQKVTLSYSMNALLVKVAGKDWSAGFSGGFGMRFFIMKDMGIFVDFREQTYRLPLANGQKTDQQVDANIAIGFVIGF